MTNPNRNPSRDPNRKPDPQHRRWLSDLSLRETDTGVVAFHTKPKLNPKPKPKLNPDPTGDVAFDTKLSSLERSQIEES